MDHRAIAVDGDQRGRYGCAMTELPGEVILHNKSARGSGHVDDLAAAFWRENGTRRLWNVGWQ